jgi:hypothetical protein
VELVDTLASGASALRGVEVQVLFAVPIVNYKNTCFNYYSMGRPKIDLMPEIPDELSTASEEARELGLSQHALNFQITEYDFLRARRLAQIEGHNSVSEIVRAALAAAFEKTDAEKPGMLVALAVVELEYRAQMKAMQAGYAAEPADTD